MAVCPAWKIKGRKRSRPAYDKDGNPIVDPSTGTVTREEYTLDEFALCGRQQSAFFRVTYDLVSDYHRNRGAGREDVFGLCDEHGAGAMDPVWWNTGFPHHGRTNGVNCPPWTRLLSGLRGSVGSVSAVELSREDARELLRQEKARGHIAGVRAGIMRMMGQSNMRKMRDEDWRAVFDGLPEEFVVSQVQGS